MCVVVTSDETCVLNFLAPPHIELSSIFLTREVWADGGCRGGSRQVQVYAMSQLHNASIGGNTRKVTSYLWISRFFKRVVVTSSAWVLIFKTHSFRYLHCSQSHYRCSESTLRYGSLHPSFPCRDSTILSNEGLIRRLRAPFIILPFPSLPNLDLQKKWILLTITWPSPKV